MSYLEQNISIDEIEIKILKNEDNKTNKKTKKSTRYIYSEIKIKLSV